MKRLKSSLGREDIKANEPYEEHGTAMQKAEVVICGAGIAGISVAYRLAVKHGMRNVVLVDERPPMTMTSDKSTEAYRNWWVGPDDAMVRLMDRSIDLLEALAESCDNRLLMNRRGYLYATADAARAEAMRDEAQLAERYGAGELRIHSGRITDPEYLLSPASGWRDQPLGADFIVDDHLIRQAFPYLSQDVYAALHTRRCGWFSGQQLGMVQFEAAREAGVDLVAGRVTSIDTTGGRVREVEVAAAGETLRIETPRVVIASGPMLALTAALLGLELPIFSELHLKVSIEDHLNVIPRDAPLLIWQDPQRIAWDDEEREALGASATTRPLLDELPAGVHLRPEGGGSNRHLILLWPYHAEPVPETFPIGLPEHYAEVCVRGMAAMVPGFERYRGHLPQPFIDGGYYTKTRENRPLAGPLEVEGAFVHGALSGFGLMASSATAELVACHLTGAALPDYAAAFQLERYEDRDYLARLETWDDSSQL